MGVDLNAIIQFFAFAQNLRRYAAVRSGSWKFFQDSNWHPPIMTNLKALTAAVVTISISLLALRSIAEIISL
jgi:adenosylmethionine-8-amino-7-oxononanoate aminotransferase